MYVDTHECALVPLEAEENVGSLGAGIIGSWELPGGALITEPSL